MHVLVYSCMRVLAYSCTCILVYSRTRILAYSHTGILANLRTWVLAYSHSHVLTNSCTHLLIYSCTHVLMYSQTHVLIYSSTHLLMYSCTYSCTHLLIYSWNNVLMYSWTRLNSLNGGGISISDSVIKKLNGNTHLSRTYFSPCLNRRQGSGSNLYWSVVMYDRSMSLFFHWNMLNRYLLYRDNSSGHNLDLGCYLGDRCGLEVYHLPCLSTHHYRLQTWPEDSRDWILYQVSVYPIIPKALHMLVRTKECF